MTRGQLITEDRVVYNKLRLGVGLKKRRADAVVVTRSIRCRGWDLRMTDMDAMSCSSVSMHISTTPNDCGTASNVSRPTGSEVEDGDS